MPAADWNKNKHCRRLSAPLMLFLVDPFEKLPDSILLLIFNKVADVKALGRCCAVSKRFHALARTVDNVVVKVDCVISADESNLNVRGRGFFNHLVRFVVGSIVKPLQALQHMIGPKRGGAGAGLVSAEVSHHSPGEVLKNFKDLEHLRIELPAGELEIEDGLLLKWKARFGSTLESCVILGASSLIRRDAPGSNHGKKSHSSRSWLSHRRSSDVDRDRGLSLEEDGSLPDSLHADGGLKLRVVWTISSLIAASGRHYLLQNIIADHPNLQSLVLTDADGQGTLCMNKQQLQQFRDKPLPTSASSNRTQVPSLNVKLWYAPQIELPGGVCLKGATLVSIRPSDQSLMSTGDVSGNMNNNNTDAVEVQAFEEPFQTAAEELVKRRTYWLEMNSF